MLFPSGLHEAELTSSLFSGRRTIGSPVPSAFQMRTVPSFEAETMCRPSGLHAAREDTAAVGDHHPGDAELACPSSKLAADPGERVIRGGGWTHRYPMSPEVTTRDKLAVTAVSDGVGVGLRCARRECGRPSRGREVRPGRAAKVTAARSALRTPNDSPDIDLRWQSGLMDASATIH